MRHGLILSISRIDNLRRLDHRSGVFQMIGTANGHHQLPGLQNIGQYQREGVPELRRQTSFCFEGREGYDAGNRGAGDDRHYRAFQMTPWATQSLLTDPLWRRISSDEHTHATRSRSWTPPRDRSA
jgi:hypothetical protein